MQPPPRCYATPGWSERPTSNIGQPDVYKHAKKLNVHQPALPRRISSAGGTMESWPQRTVSSLGQGTITKHSDVDV